MSVNIVIFSTMLIPSQVTLIPLYVVFSKIGWIDTHLPLIVPQIMVNAYGVFLMRQFMLTVPDSYIEAAKLDGAGYTWIYARIMLPLCKSALITLGMFTFSACRKGRTRLEKKKIRYISLKYKLSILLISLTLVPALTTGIFSYQILRRSLTENTQKSELSILENQMTNFDLAMHNFETILNDMVTSESTQGFLQFRKDKESEIYYSDLLILTSKLDSLINQRGDSLKMAAFLWNDGDLPLVRGDISGINLAGDYTSRKPFSGFLQADASIHWKVFYEKGEPVIYAYRTIYDTSANANIGVALINFSTDYFEELLTRAMDKNAFYALLDDEGEIVYTVGIPNGEEDGLQTLLQGKEMDAVLSQNKGTASVLTPESAYMVSYAKSTVNGWQYLYFNPLININGSIHAITWLVLLVMAVTAVLSVAAAMVFYYYLNSPIGQLSMAMAHMEKGKLDIRVDIRRKDELGKLGEGFNQMSEKIRQLIQDIEKEQNEKRRMEIRFLQAQITPHFLYNTLNSIKSLARLNRTEDAVQMTTSLISLLRCVNSGEELITLTQEVEYVKNYASVMSFRKNQNFYIEEKLEAGTGDYRIPKFSLQPFVENSIIHGFSENEKKSEIFIIRICAWLEKEYLYVRVEDDGKGFSTEEIGEKSGESGMRFTHVGIANVEERIRLYFGEEYGIKVESGPGKGTAVTLTLPGKRGTGDLW